MGNLRGGFCYWTIVLIWSQRFSIGLRSGDCAGQWLGTTVQLYNPCGFVKLNSRGAFLCRDVRRGSFLGLRPMSPGLPHCLSVSFFFKISHTLLWLQPSYADSNHPLWIAFLRQCQHLSPIFKANPWFWSHDLSTLVWKSCSINL